MIESVRPELVEGPPQMELISFPGGALTRLEYITPVFSYESGRDDRVRSP